MSLTYKDVRNKREKHQVVLQRPWCHSSHDHVLPAPAFSCPSYAWKVGMLSEVCCSFGLCGDGQMGDTQRTIRHMRGMLGHALIRELLSMLTDNTAFNSRTSELSAATWRIMVSPRTRHLHCPIHHTRNWSSYWPSSTTSWYFSSRCSPVATLLKVQLCQFLQTHVLLTTNNSTSNIFHCKTKLDVGHFHLQTCNKGS